MPLQRTKSFGGRKGPLRTGARAASVSARQSAARGATTGLKRAASVREGQVIRTAAALAQRNVFLHKEEKYFKVNGATDLSVSPVVTGEGAKTTSTLAFVTTSRINPSNPTGAVMDYCGNTMFDLQMLNPFLDSDPAPELRPYAMDGKKAVPTKSFVNWTINRNYVRNGMNYVAGSTGAGLGPPQPGTNDTQLYQNLPIRCRIVRVTPVLSPGISTPITPTEDLFLNQLGQEYSPNDDAWSVSDNEFARVNTRIYKVLGDTKFTLGQPITATWASQWLNEPENNTAWRQDLTIPDKPVLKRFTTNHQLAAKKGGEVYYDTGAAGVGTTNASSGMRREYVFMHFWYESGDGGVVDPNDPTQSIPVLVTTGKVPDALAVKVHYRIESRFREP